MGLMVNTRYQRNIILAFAVAILCFRVLPSKAQETGGTILWTAADMAESLPSVSLFRYSSAGLGSYPYLSSAPGVPMTVTLDGVPLRALSPFGPDLDLLTTQFAGSVSLCNVRELAVESIGIAPDEPVTSTSFLLGKRRRFRTNMSFNRRISERSGIVVAGASSGIHGGEFLEKSSARNYFVKYQRDLAGSGSLVYWVHALRDRDGLADLSRSDTMGERRTDGLTMAAGLDDYRLGERMALSTKLFYQKFNSRIGRYGSRRSLDDDTAGFRLNVRGGDENGYHVSLSHDIRMFDSRIHDESWTRGETGIEGGVRLASGKNSILLTVGETWSSEYGAGSMLRAEFGRWVGGMQWNIRLLHEDVIPDTGSEYYSSLLFTDSTYVEQPEIYRLNSAETSVRLGDSGEVGVFFSRYAHPSNSILISAIRSESLTDGSYLADATSLAGMRLSYGYSANQRYSYEVNGDAEYRHVVSGNTDDDLWPFPAVTASLGTRVSGDFIGDHLHAILFQTSRFLYYNAPSGLTPSDGYFLLDVGLTLRVRTVELFYTMENLTGEDILWFDALGSLGRNSMWGIRWVFYD